MNILAKIKADLFSISALVVTVLHIFMIVGAVTCWIGVQTQVLGNDPVRVVSKR
jgi:hypothetical protein